MGIETAPAFQVYVKEWRSSRAVQRMTFAERGLYFEMLLEQWENLTLADDPKEVAALLATTSAQELEIEAAWLAVRRKFVEVPGEPGRIQNLRLESVRKERRRFAKIAKKGGKARAEQARRSASGTFQPESSGEPAAAPAGVQPERQPEASTATASSSSTSSASASSFAESPLERAMDAWRLHWKRAYGFEPSLLLSPLEQMKLEQQLTAIGEPRFVQAITAYFATEETYVRNAKHPLPLFLRDPLKYLAGAPKTGSVRPRGCKHEPACTDDAAHTRRDMADRRAS